jgi:hypothetical protein
MSRRRRWVALGAVALVLIAAAIVLATRPQPRSAPPQPPAEPAPSGNGLGVNVNRLFNDGTYTPSQIDAQLAAVRATGVTLARSDALWEASEPAPPRDGVHRYRWAFDDAVAGALARHGLRWLPILDYSPPWAQSVAGQPHSPPRAVADFAAYAGAFAARYGPGGAFWRAHPPLPARPVDTYEIWNEPDNHEFWLPDPDPARYAALYLAARAAIHAADPPARVIIGGLSNPAAFLPALLRAAPSLAGHIDGVGIHPYGATPAVVAGRVSGARALLRRLGLGSVPMYVTEFGWTTSPRGALDWAPASKRPGYIAATIARLAHSDCGLAATVLYTWVTPERNPADHEDWFGINPPQGGASADVRAFTAAVAAAGRSASAPGSGPTTPTPCT